MSQTGKKLAEGKGPETSSGYGDKR
jgi:hypothetical protein